MRGEDEREERVGEGERRGEERARGGERGEMVMP
jgi:hypothetical protein